VGKEVEEITVDLFRLDSLSDQPIRFMKLDLEGGELHALRGAKLLIRKQKPVIAFECGRIDAARTSGFASEEFFALFEQLGYDIYDLFGELFGPAQFQLPWNDRTVPHYTVAALSQRQDVFQRLRDEVASQLAKVN
jgi:hypothetical protein